MKPRKFDESNLLLLRPETMTAEECTSLPIYMDDDNTYCLSCWKPTLRERFSILLFGKVWMWVMSSGTQPGVALEAARTIFRLDTE